MVYNPDVTVRSRGVMEKCTFCVQRIKGVTIGARNEGRPVRDGEIVPACAQACPTQAIVFGDLNDPESRVRKLSEHKRAYAMLEDLNVKPRTRYLARLTNPEATLGAPDGAGHGHG
jgi:molybdopterin-containing oxidoreductase family iron-sulfur binding subunit